MASDPTVTSRASTDGLLRTEPQVLLMFSCRTITATSLSRTYTPTIAPTLLVVGRRLVR